MTSLPTARPAFSAGRAVPASGPAHPVLDGARSPSGTPLAPAAGRGATHDGARSPFAWSAAPSRGWGRAASVAALFALALHAAVSVAHAHDPLFAVIVGLMGLGCAACAVRCLVTPCRRELTALLGMSAAMVAVHVAWMLASGAAAGGSHHSGALGAGGGHATSGMGTSMLGLALAEVLVAALCAVALRRPSPGVRP
jgi:hypothetical protein